MLHFYSLRKNIISLSKLFSAAAKCLLPSHKSKRPPGFINDVLWDGDCVRFKAGSASCRFKRAIWEETCHIPAWSRAVWALAKGRWGPVYRGVMLRLMQREPAGTLSTWPWTAIKRQAASLITSSQWWDFRKTSQYCPLPTTGICFLCYNEAERQITNNIQYYNSRQANYLELTRNLACNPVRPLMATLWGSLPPKPRSKCAHMSLYSLTLLLPSFCALAHMFSDMHDYSRKHMGSNCLKVLQGQMKPLIF